MPDYPASFTFISDEVSQDPLVVARFAQRHGFAGIELRSMFGRQFRDLTDRDIADLRRVLKDYRLRVHACATPLFKCARQDARAIAEHREIFRRSIDRAVALECPLLRVFSFLREDNLTGDGPLAAAAEHIARLTGLLPPGLRLGVENEASCLVGTGEETVRFLRAAPGVPMGIIWDPCNVLYVPGHQGAATEHFAVFASRIVHIHVKDAVRRPGGAEARRLGEGEVGWPQHLADLARGGYRGLLSLETHWRHAAIDTSALHLPGGYAFSHGGESASDECLAALRKLLTARSQGAE